MLIHLMEDSSLITKEEASEKKPLFLNALYHIPSSEQVQYQIKHKLENLLFEDKSYRNQKTLVLLNSNLGRALREQIWGDSSVMDFWQLLKFMPTTSWLFQDLGTLDSCKEWKSPQKKFVEAIIPWLFVKAINESSLIPGSSAPVPYNAPTNVRFSLFNFFWASHPITDFYIMNLCRDIRNEKNLLQTLINEGCFRSWKDLFEQLFDLKGLNKSIFMEVMKDMTSNFTNMAFAKHTPEMSVLRLGSKLESYLKKQRDESERFEGYLPIYQEIYELILSPITQDQLRDSWGNLNFGLLNQCIKGFTQQVGENSVSIEPNWEKAKILYNRLYEIAQPIERNILNKMMQPIFNQEKGFNVKETSEVEEPEDTDSWSFYSELG